MRALIVATVLAGCGTDGSNLYVHTTDSSIQKIELFVGKDDCNDKSGHPCAVRPPTVDNYLSVGSGGGAWLRDISGLFEADVHDGIAKFRITGTSRSPVQVIAIGYGPPSSIATSAPTAVAVVRDLVLGSTSGDVVTVELAPASKLEGTEEMNQTDGDFVYVWNNSTCAGSQCAPPGDCVMVEHRARGKQTLDVIVPEGDEDCDGAATDNPTECDWLWPNVMNRPPQASQSDCAISGQVNGGEGACLLGGGACSDGTGVDTKTCTPLASPAYCLPTAVCATPCAAPANQLPLGQCLDDLLNGTAGSPVVFPAMQCFVYVDDSGRPCPMSPLFGTLDVSPLYLSSPNRCMDIQFAKDSLDRLSTSSTLQLGGASFDVTLMPTGTNPSCAALLTWQGQFMGSTWQGGNVLPNKDGDRAWMIADIETDSSRHVLLPVAFDFHFNSCGGTTPAFYCSPMQDFPSGIASDDQIVNCAR